MQAEDPKPPTADPLSGRLAEGVHRLDVRIYYEDTDAGGIVYHAAYVRFMERGRTDFLRSLGIVQSRLAAAEDPALFAVSAMQLQFHRPARLDDVVTVATSVIETSGARLRLEQAILRGAEKLVSAEVTVAALGPGGRPRRLPASVRAAFDAHRAP